MGRTCYPHALPPPTPVGSLLADIFSQQETWGQKRFYKDRLKGTLKSCSINPGVLETTVLHAIWGSNRSNYNTPNTEWCYISADTNAHSHNHILPQTQHSHVLTVAGHVAPGLDFTATFNGTADSSGCLNIPTKHPRTEVLFEIDGLHKKKCVHIHI